MTSISAKLPTFLLTISLSLIFNTSGLAQTHSANNTATNSPNRPTTVYFLRHAESQHSSGDNICDSGDCSETLSDKGLHRANLLASWFLERRVLRAFDTVYTSQIYSTYQTVLPTATLADLDITQLPDNTGDLNPETTECQTIDAILNAPAGDTILVAGDSSTLYNMMGDGNGRCTGLGLLSDTDPGNHRFPKDSNGDVRDYGDVWKVTIRGDHARFVYRVNLETTQLSVIDRAR